MKNDRFKIIIPIVIFLILLGFYSISYRGNEKNLLDVRYFQISDGGSKSQFFTNVSDVSYWNEWWYLNFQDRNYDIDGSVQFTILGNISSSKNSRTGIYFLLFYNNTTYYIQDWYSPDFFSAKTDLEDVKLGENYIKMIDPNTYSIFYESKNKEVFLNLSYERLTVSFTRSVNYIKPPEGISGQYDKNSIWWWSIPLPLARVSGVFKFKNSTFNIDGNGYHEHICGILDWDNVVKWTWGEIGIPEKKLFVNFASTVIGTKNISEIYNEYFLAEESSFLGSKESLNITAINPNEYSIVGKNDHYQIELNITKKTSFLIEGGKHNLTVSYFSGRITKDNSVYEFRDVVGFFDEW